MATFGQFGIQFTTAGTAKRKRKKQIINEIKKQVFTIKISELQDVLLVEALISQFPYFCI